MSVVARLRIVFYLAIPAAFAPLMAVVDARRAELWLMTTALLVMMVLATIGIFLGQVAHHDARYERLERDSLTGLATKGAFLEAVEAHSGIAAVAIFDIDDFRLLNETIGRPLGDQVLQTVAERMLASIRPTDIAARIGVDRFALFLPSVESDAVAASMCSRLQSEFFTLMSVGGLDIDVRATVGAALTQIDSPAVDTLHHSLIALEAAKAHGTPLEVFRPENEQRTEAAMAVITQVHQGIERREFAVHLQPVVDTSDNRTLGFEALVRWAHPERGLIPPRLFIDQIENLPVGRELTDYILRESLTALASLGSDRDLALWVNLNARDVEDINLPLRIGQLLKEFGIAARRLNIEIPEAASTRHRERAENVLSQIRDLGCGVAIDNFGRSAVPIDFLAKLPATELKIDASFVARCVEDSTARTVIRHCVGLGHSAGLRVVAKGVERQAVMDCLVDLGCDAVQGFHLAHPMPVGQVKQWLANDRVFY